MSENAKFILVKGDVSGIQEFIFNVKSDEAARELKGRSFFIKILIEVAIQSLLDRFEINHGEYDDYKISTSGGNFIIKLPLIKDHSGIIEQIQEHFTSAIQYTGLNISFSWVNYDRSSYKECLHNLNQINREIKYLFYNQNHDYFKTFQKSGTTAIINNKWNTITEQLRTNNAFTITKEKKGKILEIQDSKIFLSDFKIEFNKNEIGYKLKDYLESLIPKMFNGETKPFKELSETDKTIKRGKECSIQIKGGKKGLAKLGILAMDVDGLGNYIENIANEGDHKIFDNKLKMFFNQSLREIINDDNISYKNNCGKFTPLFKDKIYSVTAGGDDSFFVGKWNTVLEFADRIQKKFNKVFEAENLSISGGFVIVHSKYPVVRFADLVEDALKQAKYKYDSKGNICLFGEVLKLRTLIKNDKIEFLDEINYLRKLLNNKIVSGGLLAKARLAANEVKRYDQFRLEDFWKMSYFLRDYPKKVKIEIMDKISMYIEYSTKTNDPLVKQSFRKILPIAARLAELDKR